MSLWKHKKKEEDDEEEFTITRNDAPAVKVETAKPKQKGTAAGGGAVLELLQGQFGNLNKRGRIALELLTTERVYCECLTSTINAFLIPLRAGLCPSFDKNNLPAIFMNIDKILIANTKFLHEMEYLVFSPRFSGEVAMDEALQFLVPALKLYPEYVKGHDNAIMLVNRLEGRDPEFKDFLIRAKECSDAKLDLLACLIAPVQRVPRYRLLLEELMKNTTDDYPDKAKLQDILSFVCNLADKVNSDMRKQENLQKQIRVLRAFVGNQMPVQPSTDRTLIRYGPLERRVRYGTLKTRWFFLFNDCLIYGKVNSVNSIFGHEPFEGKLFVLSQILHGTSARETPIQSGTNEFEIISQEKSFTCVAENSESKKQWLADFASLGSEGSAEHAPIWVADTEAERCMICGLKFTLTLRRHHCRCCGVVVCGQCSHTRAKLPHMEAMVRVCDKCAENLKDKKAASLPYKLANRGFHKFMAKIGPHDDVQQQQQHTPRQQPSKPTPSQAPVEQKKEASTSVESVSEVPPEHKGPQEVVLSTSADDDDVDSDVEEGGSKGQLLLLDFSDLSTGKSQNQNHSESADVDPFAQPPEPPSATDILLGDASYSALDLLMEQKSPARDGALGSVTTSELLSFLELTGSTTVTSAESSQSLFNSDPFAVLAHKEVESKPEDGVDKSKEQVTVESAQQSSDPFAVLAHKELEEKPKEEDKAKEQEKPKEEDSAAKEDDPFAVDAEPSQNTVTASTTIADDEDPFADPFATDAPVDVSNDDDDNPFAIGEAESKVNDDSTVNRDNDDPFADMIDNKEASAETTKAPEDDADNPFNI